MLYNKFKEEKFQTNTETHRERGHFPNDTHDFENADFELLRPHKLHDVPKEIQKPKSYTHLEKKN